MRKLKNRNHVKRDCFSTKRHPAYPFFFFNWFLPTIGYHSMRYRQSKTELIKGFCKHIVKTTDLEFRNFLSRKPNLKLYSFTNQKRVSMPYLILLTPLFLPQSFTCLSVKNKTKQKNYTFLFSCY